MIKESQLPTPGIVPGPPAWQLRPITQCHKSLRVELISKNQLIKIHAQSKSSLFLKGDHGVEHNHVIKLNLTLFIIPSGSALPAGLGVFKKSEFPLDVAC